MPKGKDQTEALLKLVSLGNDAAAVRLLNLHRRRLKKMVSLRIDEGLAEVQDPSDVVHETILAAAQKLAEYARKPDVPFYPWLRRMAWGRLVELHRQNLSDPEKADFRAGQLTSKCLSEMVKCFVPAGSDKSNPAEAILPPLGADGSTLSRRRARSQLEVSLSKLDPSTRELLLLYYVEQLTVPEIASVLAIDSSQVKLRHMKAISKLRSLLDPESKATTGKSV